MATVHIASLAAQIILNTYKPMELALRGHLKTYAQERDRTRKFFDHEKEALTTRPQL